MKHIRVVVLGLILIAGLALGGYTLVSRHRQAVAQATPPQANPPQSQASQTASTGARPFLASNNVSTSYRDGSYTGSRENAFYGYVQVKAVVNNGQLTNVQVLEYPTHAGTSRYINSIALPYLVQEAVQVQDPTQVNLISGATLSSEAFVRSLDAALMKAAG